MRQCYCFLNRYSLLTQPKHTKTREKDLNINENPVILVTNLAKRRVRVDGPEIEPVMAEFNEFPDEIFTGSREIEMEIQLDDAARLGAPSPSELTPLSFNQTPLPNANEGVEIMDGVPVVTIAQKYLIEKAPVSQSRTRKVSENSRHGSTPHHVNSTPLSTTTIPEVEHLERTSSIHVRSSQAISASKARSGFVKHTYSSKSRGNSDSGINDRKIVSADSQSARKSRNSFRNSHDRSSFVVSGKSSVSLKSSKGSVKDTWLAFDGAGIVAHVPIVSEGQITRVSDSEDDESDGIVEGVEINNEDGGELVVLFCNARMPRI
jgi:hypothetical protein